MPTPTGVDENLEALLQPAWTALGVDPGQLGAAAAELKRGRVAPRERARRDVFAASFLARWHVARGEAGIARALCAEALGMARQARAADAGDAAGAAGAECSAGMEDAVAAVADVQALIAINERRFDDAVQAVTPWLAHIARLPEPLSTTWALLRYLMLTRTSLAMERTGRHDEALQPNYATLAAARACGQAPYLARALASVGGLQGSLSNFEDALELCSEAWALCEPPGWVGCMASAGPNLTIALWGLGRVDEARRMAHKLLELEPRLPPAQRHQRHFIMGIAFSAAGELALAQECLDLGLAAQPRGAPPRCEWVFTQAHLWNRAGRPREALQSVLEQLARDDVVESRFPVDLIELHVVAARSCEALGELRQALHHEREASRARQRANRIAAQARQRTLQIRHDLDTARRQRDQALQAQERLAALNAQLREAGEAKTRFLAAASHDLRQPLHALTLQAAALRPHVQDAQPARLLAGVERCAASLTALFDALLDLSRADMGLLVPQRQPLNIATLLADLMDEHRAQAAAKGLRLAFRAVPAGPAGFGTDSDPQLLGALVRNLLVNALRYTESGTVLLCLRPAWQAADGGSGAARGWRVQVRDSGIGIAAEEQARVFEEFYQLGNPARQREQGLGMGLAIVQRLARLLQHPVALRSAPGRGTCVELRLPWAAYTAAADRRTPAPALQGLRVAVLEDDRESGEALAGLLRQWGCEVRHFERAQALWQAIERHGPPQALLADHRLPGSVSGADAIAVVRARCGAGLPALILTGDVSPDTQAAFTAAALEVMPKPVPVPRLARWLEAVAAR
ncbi:MAG: hybrid sensor histidine kinase/response regulator [Rubrivivax sp.]|nr:hybrid sensor histidine kinase/response regulator [Rubrivivax sp.]